MDRQELDQLTHNIIQSAIEVHRHLGPGLLENLYQECLAYELHARGINFVADESIPVCYKGQQLNGRYRIDLIVENEVLVELKAVETVLPVHCAQVLSYLRLTGKNVGLLMNFNVSYLSQGVKRIVNHF